MAHALAAARAGSASMKGRCLNKMPSTLCGPAAPIGIKRVCGNASLVPGGVAHKKTGPMLRPQGATQGKGKKMKLSDLGIDTKTGYHDKRLTQLEGRFLGLLWTEHQGEANKIGADLLAVNFAHVREGGQALCDEDLDVAAVVAQRVNPTELGRLKRDVRYVQNHLLTRHDNLPILSKAGTDGGYWIAENEAEANDFYESFRKRGLTGLVKASRGKKAILVDMMRQLSFEFDELVDLTEQTGIIRQRVSDPTPIEVVDAFLEKMTADPAKFADGLRKIGRKYGSVLLPKGAVRELTEQAAKLQRLVESIGRGV